jgi:hypothetical protein
MEKFTVRSLAKDNRETVRVLQELSSLSEEPRSKLRGINSTKSSDRSKLRGIRPVASEKSRNRVNEDSKKTARTGAEGSGRLRLS